MAKLAYNIDDVLGNPMARVMEEPIPSFDDALPVIQNYWRGRPTVLGWLHLGGELSPSCEEIEV